MMKINSFNKALKLTWMRRLLYDTFTNRSPLIQNNEHVLKTGRSIVFNPKSRFLPFWKEAVEHWKELLTKTEEPDLIETILAQPLWNDSFLKDIYLFRLAWYNASTLSVRDMLNANGQPKSFFEFVSQYQITSSFLLHSRKVNNIPWKWRRSIPSI